MKVAVLLFCFLFFGKLFAQKFSWPPKEWIDSLYCRTYRGFVICNKNYPASTIILKNGDTIKNCMFRFRNNYFELLPNGNNKSVLKPASSILKIYTKLPNDQIIEFRPVKNSLCKLYKEKGNVSIYDSNTGLSIPDLREPIILINSKKVVRLLPFYKAPSSETIKLRLLQCINNRYKSGFESGHFESAGAMIDFILDKENEKLTAKITR